MELSSQSSQESSGVLSRARSKKEGFQWDTHNRETVLPEPAGEPEEGGPPQAPARAAPPDRCRVHDHEQERVSGYTPPSEQRRRRAHAAADEREPRFRVEWKVEAVWGPGFSSGYRQGSGR